MTSGLYAIKNLVSSRKYFGISKDIASRWETHRFDLRKGSHYNTHLQRSWDLHGEMSFEFILVHECPRVCALTFESILIECLGQDLYNQSTFKAMQFTDREKTAEVSLRRRESHLRTTQSMSPQERREKWGIPGNRHASNQSQEVRKAASERLKEMHASGRMSQILTPEVLKKRGESIRRTRAKNSTATVDLHKPKRGRQKPPQVRREDSDIAREALLKRRLTLRNREVPLSQVMSEVWAPSSKKFLRLARLARTRLEKDTSKFRQNYQSGVFARPELAECIRLLREGEETEAVEYAERLFAKRPNWFEEVTE